MKISGRIKILLLAAFFLLPFVAAYLTYYFWKPQSHTNYGELISPRVLPDIPLKLIDGTPFHLKQLRGKWVLLQVDSGNCHERCLQKLYNMRQIRLVQGKEMARIERVWLITNNVAPAPELNNEYTGTWQVRIGRSALLQQLSNQDSITKHIYLIDPLGNLMMRFPENPDSRRMIKDIQRLLKVSRIG